MSQKSEPPKHFATAAANLHRFKWNFAHTRRHLFLSSTSNFIRIPYSVYEMFNYFKLLVLKSMARITETRCWDNSCCQPFVQSLVTSSPSSKQCPAHRARETVALLSAETPDFISPMDWPPNRVEHFDCSGWHQLRRKLMTCGWCYLKIHILVKWRRIYMKLSSNVCNRCRLVCVKFYLNRSRFAVVVAKC